MRIDPRARTYIARRRAEGKSTAEAMRSSNATSPTSSTTNSKPTSAPSRKPQLT